MTIHSKGRRESEVSAAIQAYLSTRTDLFWWRANTQAGVARSGQYMRSGVKGQADIQGVQPRLHNVLVVRNDQRAPATWIYGQFFAIEVKREKGGKLSEDQRRWGENVANHGGIYIVARSVRDVAEALGPELAKVDKVTKPRVYPR